MVERLSAASLFFAGLAPGPRRPALPGPAHPLAHPLDQRRRAEALGRRRPPALALPVGAAGPLGHDLAKRPGLVPGAAGGRGPRCHPPAQNRALPPAGLFPARPALPALPRQPHAGAALFAGLAAGAHAPGVGAPGRTGAAGALRGGFASPAARQKGLARRNRAVPAGAKRAPPQPARRGLPALAARRAGCRRRAGQNAGGDRRRKLLQPDLLGHRGRSHRAAGAGAPRRGALPAGARGRAEVLRTAEVHPQTLRQDEAHAWQTTRLAHGARRRKVRDKERRGVYGRGGAGRASDRCGSSSLRRPRSASARAERSTTGRPRIC